MKSERLKVSMEACKELMLGTLMLYQFYNQGVCWRDDSDPDHSPASEMSLAELDYLTQAIYWHLRCDVEKGE